MSGSTSTSAPRRGLSGVWDRLAGPGATRAENALNLAWTLLFTAGVIVYTLLGPLEWTALQLMVVAVFALDLAGGASVNASPTARRWWHRPSQGAREHFSFVALHVHPFVLALLFAGFSWGSAALIYGYLLVAALTILAAPRDLQRPVAFIAYALALLLSFYVLSVPAGLEWFAPLYYLKLLVAHLPADPRHAERG